MTYTNLPVYIGRANSYFSSRSFNALNFMILANKVSVTNSTSKTTNRKLGSWVNKEAQFAYTSDKKATISVEFYLKPKIRSSQRADYVYGFLFNDDYVYENLRGNNNGANFFPIRIGKMHFNKCFLNSYSIDMKPNSPVRVTAVFDSKVYFQGNTRKESRPPYEIYDEYIDSKKIIHGSTCELVGDYSQIIDEKIFSNIVYNKSFAYDHTYRPQDGRATSSFTRAINSSLNIQGVDLKNMINTKGKKINTDLVINLKNSQGEQILGDFNPFNITIKSGASVNENSFSVQGGDTLQSSISIEEVNY